MINKNRGGISTRILLVIFTLAILASSVYFLLEKQRKTYEINHRKAVELCEYGFQQFMEKLIEKLNNDTSITGINRTDYNGGWYEVNVSGDRKGNKLFLTITSIGNKGTQSTIKKEVISLKRTVSNGDSLWTPIKK
jgi:hypothetical protein